MDEDEYWRRYRAYWKRRAGSQGALILGPVAIVISVVWIFFPGVVYMAGDIRGQLPWRLLMGAPGLIIPLAVMAYSVRWLRADRHRDKEPRWEDVRHDDRPR